MLVVAGLGDMGQLGQSKTQPITGMSPQKANGEPPTVSSSPMGDGEVGGPRKPMSASVDPRLVVWKQDLWENVEDSDALSLEERISSEA